MNLEISVIIPTYNRKKIILQAIDSVLQQEPKNYEVIVVDDGSTDGTVQYLESLKLPIKILAKENGGVSSGRNMGIINALGDYIAFLDSDDLWLPGILKAQLDYLQLHPNIPLVYVDEQIEIEGKIINETRLTMKKWTEVELSRCDLLALGQSLAIQTSAVMVKKSIFDQIGMFNENLRVYEDFDMWNRVSEVSKLGYIKKPLAIFRWEADTEHLSKPSAVKKFIEDGNLYMKLYVERRRNRKLTKRENGAVNRAMYRMGKLKKLVVDFEDGKMTEIEFADRKQEISME